MIKVALFIRGEFEEALQFRDDQHLADWWGGYSHRWRVSDGRVEILPLAEFYAKHVAITQDTISGTPRPPESLKLSSLRIAYDAMSATSEPTKDSTAPPGGAVELGECDSFSVQSQGLSMYLDAAESGE